MNPDLKRLLEIRQQLGKASTAKIKALLLRCGADGRARGMLMYHGAGTGRWAGKGFQPQNLPSRDLELESDQVEECLMWAKAGMLEEMYPDPLGAAASCIRGMLIPTEGHRFLCADFSAIEGRVIAWLAGEEYVLRAYADGKRLYCVAASGIYNVPYEAIEKGRKIDPEYKKMDGVGKTVELACFAEDSLVLTDQGLVPIQNVTLAHRIWDGIDWVKHEGSVCQGTREVLSYDGLTATPDHQVFNADGTSSTLAFSHQHGKRLLVTEVDGEAIRACPDSSPRDLLHTAKMAVRVCSNQVRQVRKNQVGKLRKLVARKVQRMSFLHQQRKVSVVHHGQPPCYSGKAAVYQPQGQRMEKLRRTGGNFRLPFCHCGMPVYIPKSGRAKRQGTGSYRQPKGVCSGKSALGYAQRKQFEQTTYPVCAGCKRMGGKMLSLRQVPNRKTALPGDDTGRDNRTRPTGSSRQAKKLAQDTRKTCRVYDILNAGPRHRFTVSGKLVHNCNYQGGLGAFRRMEQNTGDTGLSDDEVKENIAKWRESRPMTVALWKSLEECATLAVRNPGNKYEYNGIAFKVTGNFLLMRIPGGKILYYYNPAIEEQEMPYKDYSNVSDEERLALATPAEQRTPRQIFLAATCGEPVLKECVSFWGVDSLTHKWVKQFAYGGKWANNATQAFANWLLQQAGLRLEQAGYKLRLPVHDEWLSEREEGQGSLEEYLQIMTVVPECAKGLPLAAAGWEGPRYKKD